MKQNFYADNILIDKNPSLIGLGDIFFQQNFSSKRGFLRRVYNIAISILLVAIYFSGSLSYAASQGKLGKISTGSVDISVHVNQTFSTLAPDELVLNKSSIDNKISKPFCISHIGFSQNLHVPFELKVLDLQVQNSNSFKQNTYNIYLESSGFADQKLLPGKLLHSNDAISHNDDMQQNCIDSGDRLVLELNKNLSKAMQKEDQSTILVLMVSPS